MHEKYAVFRIDSEYIDYLIQAVAKSDMTDRDKEAIVRFLRATHSQAGESYA